MASIIASGDYWRLEDNGTLYIYCIGDMPYENLPPWKSESDSIENVIIESGVTNIGKYAFSSFNYLTSVTIPNTVTNIGYSAFGCMRLTSVTIPDSVKSIEKYAFGSCSALQSITIPYGITVINQSTFANCRALAIVTIPESVTKIEHSAFLDCRSLTDIYYGATETKWNAVTIREYGNDMLTSATIHYAEPMPTPVTLSSIVVTTPPTKTAYAEGEAFDLSGMIVTASYSDASTATVTGYSVSPSGSLSTSDTSVTVSYMEDGVTATATVEITVTVKPFPTSWPRSAREVMREIAYRIGAPLDPRTVLGVDEIEDTALKMSMREVAGYIAAMNGGNWTITDDGYLYLVPLSMAARVLGDENGVPILFGEALLLV